MSTDPTSALSGLLQAAGAQHAGAVDQGPLHYGDPAVEYDALMQGAGLVDFSHRTQVEMTGDDRASFLHNLCTNDIRKLAPGSGCEAFLTNIQGKILAHILVFAGADSLTLETMAGQGETLVAHLDRYLIREKVELHDRSQDWAELLLGGKEVGSLLAKLGAALPEQRLQHQSASIAGKPVQLRRVDMLATPCVLVVSGRSDIVEVWQALHSAGATPSGRQALEAGRIEAGFPWYGQDISDANLPQEVGRDLLAISFVKGCYLGQETVARLDALGHVNRTLVGLRFSGSPPPAGLEFLVDGKSVGRVTSSAFSPRRQVAVGLGYVRSGHNQPGSKLAYEGGTAEVTELPMTADS